MKKTKQKEERYKNANKMSDVGIMKKIILQIYNNLQVLWSSKVKFVSLSQLLGCPLFRSNLVLSHFQFLLSHLLRAMGACATFNFYNSSFHWWIIFVSLQFHHELYKLLIFKLLWELTFITVIKIAKTKFWLLIFIHF